MLSMRVFIILLTTKFKIYCTFYFLIIPVIKQQYSFSQPINSLLEITDYKSILPFLSLFLKVHGHNVSIVCIRKTKVSSYLIIQTPRNIERLWCRPNNCRRITSTVIRGIDISSCRWQHVSNSLIVDVSKRVH